MRATIVSSISWKVPLVTHRKRTMRKMPTAFHSSADILPMAASSPFRRSMPPSIWGTCSSFFIGKNTYMPRIRPTTRMITDIGPTATSHSL